jgi:hypothetical protein
MLFCLTSREAGSRNQATKGVREVQTSITVMFPEFQGINSMADKSGQPEKQQPLELIPDHLGEDRHEFVAKLAYQLWEERGHPFGSPEVDWFQAERAVYSSLLASGLLARTANDSENMAEKIYR